MSMTLADTAPLRSLLLIVTAASGVAVALVCANPTAPAAAAHCLPRPGDPVEQPVPDDRGGYFVAAEVTASRSLATSVPTDHIELCVVGGARIGVRTLSVEHASYDWHPGDRVLAHVIPGRIGACAVPRGTSLFHVECSGQPPL